MKLLRFETESEWGTQVTVTNWHRFIIRKAKVNHLPFFQWCAHISAASCHKLLQLLRKMSPRSEHTCLRFKKGKRSGLECILRFMPWLTSTIWFWLDRFASNFGLLTLSKQVFLHILCIYTNPRPHKAHVPIGARLMEPLPPQRHDGRIKTFPISAFLQPHDKSFNIEFFTDRRTNDMRVS